MRIVRKRTVVFNLFVTTNSVWSLRTPWAVVVVVLTSWKSEWNKSFKEVISLPKKFSGRTFGINDQLVAVRNKETVPLF